MMDMAEFIRMHVPAYYWWSMYCAAFIDVTIISPNLDKIDKIIDIISIDTAPPTTILVVARPPPKRLPNRGDTTTNTTTNKRKYTKAKNEPTTALSIESDAPASGRHRRTTTGKQSSRFGDSSSDDDCLDVLMVDEVVIVEVDTDDGDDGAMDLIGWGEVNKKKDREGEGRRRGGEGTRC